MIQCSRRHFLGLAGAALAATLTGAGATPTVGRRSGARLILLGTGGGPRPRAGRAAPAQVIVVDDAAYVVDCGSGVATQLVRAGVPLASVRDVFITHDHFDHDADYGNLLYSAWISGLHGRVDTWGPPPLSRITRLYLQMTADEVASRIADEGREPFAPLIHAHELTRAGKVMDDARVRVTCALVDHPPLRTAFAYRFDTSGRSIVISGDTRRSDALVALARGADVLVHEAMYPSAVERLSARVPSARRLSASILGHHSSAEDAGRVAQAAGVGLLVLSHLVPADDPAVTEELWLEAARRTFTGKIVVGADLMEI